MEPGNIFIPYKMFVGLFIPNVIMESDLSSPAKILYGKLCQYSGENGKCYPSQKQLADTTKIAARTILIALAELEKKGYIKRIKAIGVKRLEHYHDTYLFLWHHSFDNAILRQPDIPLLCVSGYANAAYPVPQTLRTQKKDLKDLKDSKDITPPPNPPKPGSLPNKEQKPNQNPLEAVPQCSNTVVPQCSNTDDPRGKDLDLRGKDLDQNPGGVPPKSLIDPQSKPHRSKVDPVSGCKVTTIGGDGEDLGRDTSVSPTPNSIPLPDWVPLDAWDLYLHTRKSMGIGCGTAVHDLLIDTLTKLKAEGNDPKEVLNQSITNSWKGLFPLKSSGGGFNSKRIVGGAVPVPGKYAKLFKGE